MPSVVAQPDKVSQVNTRLARLLPLPLEQLQPLDPADLQHLLQVIQDCPDDAALRRLAFQLRRSQLSDLFHALLVLTPPADRLLEPRLLTLIRLRMTPSLAQLAWSFYQQYFPNERLDRLMTMIQPVLKDQQITLPCAEALAGLDFNADLPAALVDHLSLDLAEIRRTRLKSPDRGTQPMASAALPAKPVRTVAVQPRRAGQSLLRDWLADHSILPERPFAAALLTAYFNRCPEQEVLANRDLFIQTVAATDLPNQVAILENYLAKPRLEPVWASINSALLQRFGGTRSENPSEASPLRPVPALLPADNSRRVWDYVDAAAVRRFRQWELLDRINRHVGNAPQKTRFYQLFMEQIQQVTEWREGQLVIWFKDYLLVDQQAVPDDLLCYDRVTFELLTDGQTADRTTNQTADAPLDPQLEAPADRRCDLFQPNLPVIESRQVVLTSSRHNIVRLHLNEVDFLFARDYLHNLLFPHKKLGILSL